MPMWVLLTSSSSCVLVLDSGRLRSPYRVPGTLPHTTSVHCNHLRLVKEVLLLSPFYGWVNRGTEGQ